MNDTIPLTQVSAELRRLTGANPPTYRALWYGIVDGKIPGELVNGRRLVQRADMPLIAAAMGMLQAAAEEFDQRRRVAGAPRHCLRHCKRIAARRLAGGANRAQRPVRASCSARWRACAMPCMIAWASSSAWRCRHSSSRTGERSDTVCTPPQAARQARVSRAAVRRIFRGP